MQRIKHLALALVLPLALSWLILEGVSAATSATPPPDGTHPWVMKQAGDAMANASVGALKPFAPATPVPAAGGSYGPQREVFGFALASSLSDPTLGYPTWEFSLLTTVAFFGLHIKDDGTIASDSGLSVWNSSQLTGLLNAAHPQGTKVVLTIILQDFNAGTPHMCSGLANRATTVSQTVAQVTAKGVDGVNIDYEGLNGTCPNGQSARSMMTDFAHRLRAALPAGSLLSVDTYASSAADPYGFFDVPGLNASVDAFFVMAYDLEYSNWAHQPPSCVRFCLGPTAPLTGYYYNDSVTATQYTSAVPASKVILGVPYYGRKSCVSSAAPNQYPSDTVSADGYEDAAHEYQSNLVKAGSYQMHRDPNDKAGGERWDAWYNTSLNCERELYWDDTYSLAQKYNLVNKRNLRGVGIWTLNYGGGDYWLWATLNTYFSCPASIVAPATSATVSYTIQLSAGSCNAAYYDVQLYDQTLKQGWFQVRQVSSTAATVSTTLAGFPGHTYQVRARAHSTGGVIGPWAFANVAIASNATFAGKYKAIYTADAFGGVSADSSPPLGVSGYWAGWQIVHAAHALPGSVPVSGATLDGFGGLHPYGASITISGGPYWKGWDIARDFAFLPDAGGGYLLDAYGGLHPFSVNKKPAPPATSIDTYWSGRDMARKVVIFGDGTGGYVLDVYGGVHAFGIGHPRPAAAQLSAYWKGWNIARDVILVPGTRTGYVLDGFGGLHPFTIPGQAMPAALKTSAYWKGWDIGRAAWIIPSSTASAAGGYVLDGFGGLHPFGNAPAAPAGPYWPGQDIARSLAGF